MLIQNLSAQRWGFGSGMMEQRIKKDVYVLASDSFHGRETGTDGEKLASDYIIKQFKDIGLVPLMANKSYLQPFDFTDGLKASAKNELIINQKTFKLGKDFYPLSYSSNTSIEGDIIKIGFGIVSPKNNHNDYQTNKDVKGKIVVIETSIPGKYSKDSKFAEFGDLQIKVDTAIAHGAIGIIFINSEKGYSNPSEQISSRISQSSVPVIFVDEMAYKLLMDGTTWHAKITTDLEKVHKTGNNVVGFLDQKSANTIVIGAHYDHLGMGGENSRDPLVKAVHNGADDNASGTAAMLEIARYLCNSGPLKNNYIFVAFSGEEKGIFGSTKFVNSNDYDLAKVNYMFNFDMVGKLDTSKKGLIINGIGTSPVWDTLITNTKSSFPFKIRTTQSGMGGSDQMPFYLKNIPVLFFITDVHDDYHKATDDADKLNYPGEAAIVKYSELLIKKLDNYGKLSFIKSKDSVAGNNSNVKKVTLGVVPDYTFEGGMKIEAVTDGKPAAKAGMKGGDIIIKIGDYEVKDMKTYMKALGNFKKGDKPIVIYKRGAEELKVEVEL